MTTNLKRMLCWDCQPSPTLNQLRTMQSLDLTMVNEMLRSVCQPHIALDSYEQTSHSCKVKGHYANNVRLRNLSLGTPPRSGAPYTRRGHIQTMSAWLSRQPLNHSPLFLHCQRPFPLPQRLVHLPSWQAHRFRPLRKAGYNYWSTAAAHLIWSTPR